MGFLRDAGTLLVYLVFGLLMLILLLRLALPLTRVRFNNPICQFVYKFTNPLVGPLAQIIPPRKQFSFATLVLLFIVALLELCLLMLLSGLPLLPAALALGALGGLLYYALGVAFWSILLRAIMSFFSPDRRNPAVEVLHSLTDPLLQPFRRLPPRGAALDLSPLYAAVTIRLCMLAIVHLFGPLGTVFLPL
jgi:YggT family protein